MTGKKSPGKPRPRITDQQISDMMRLRRQGKSISAIARAINCNRQTVRVYLKERQADVLADEARKQVLIDELRSHFLELAISATATLKVRVDASPSEGSESGYPTTGSLFLRLLVPISLAGRLGLPGPGSANYTVSEWGRMYELPSRDKQLIQALREHIKDSDLWFHWDSWRKEVADYETLCRQLGLWVYTKTEPKRWQEIDAEYMDKVRYWLFGNILLKTSGAAREELVGSGRNLTTPAGDLVARAADSASRQALQEYLDSILEEAEQQPQWSALESATAQLMQGEKQKRLNDIANKVSSALDGIERMRAFPGHCHLCPV
jgi:transposase-like protein